MYWCDFDGASPEPLGHSVSRGAGDAPGELLREAGHLQATQILMDFLAVCSLLGGLGLFGGVLADWCLVFGWGRAVVLALAGLFFTHY